MPNPKLFYNNLLRTARLGNDGTAYATCAEAVADADDDYNVRGDIIPADDVPNLSDLEGAGVVFDTTKNKYRITDTAAAMRRLSALSLVPAQSFIDHSVVVGSYLYSVHFVSPAVVSKIDLTSWEIVDAIFLNPDEASGLSITADSLSLYVGCNTSPGKIVRINIQSFERTGVITLDTGENTVNALTVSGSYLYAGLGTTAGKVVRINTGSWEVAGTTITFAGGENVVNTLTVSGSYLYAGLGTTAGKVVRIEIGTWSISGSTITFAGGEDDVRALEVSGSYLYAGCYTTAGKVVRINTGTWAIDGATITFSAGENQVRALAVSGSYLYAGLGTTAGKVIRINTGTWAVDGATITLASGENDVRALAVSGSYLYAGCYTTAGKVVRINTDTWAIDGTTITLDTGENDISSIIVSGIYLYIGIETSPGRIVRMNLNTGAVDGATITLAVGENLVSSLAVSGVYLYVGCYTIAGKVVRINTSTWEIEGATITFAAGENQVRSLAASGSYLYAGCYTIAGKVVRINTDTWAIDGATITFASGENWVYALAVSGSYLYVGLGTIAGKVARINMGTWAVDGATITFAGGENDVRALTASGIYLYAGCFTGPGKVVRINTSTWLIDGTTITFDTGENSVRALEASGSYLYAGLGTTAGKVVRINTGTWAIDGATITFDTGENDIRGLAIFDTYLYAGSHTSPAWIVKNDPLAYLQTFEPFQTQDIGDSFTVRAGLTCAQSDPLRPVHYIADTHLSPVALGLDNTLHSIRAHAPNLVEGGGFESGAFGDWTAGANWAIDSTNELEGLYSAAWNTAADNNLTRAITGILDSRKTYRCIFKAKTLTGDASAGVMTAQVKEAGSGDDVDAGVTGNAPAITTTPTWYEFDITPDFDTENAEIRFVPALAQKGTATAVIIDEVYLYEKHTINSLIVERHNWYGKGNIIVNGWRVSQFRSTAAADANNKTQLASFSVDDRRAIEQALTSTVYPIIEIVLPAVSGWIPQAGEAYVGDYWQPDFNPEAPFDPLEIDENKLRRLRIRFTALDYAYRYDTIREIFEKLAAGEPLWWKYENDKPLQVESAMSRYRSAHNPTFVDMNLEVKERL